MKEVKFHAITYQESTWGRMELQLSSFLTSASDGGGWSTPLPGHFIPGHDPVSIIQENR